MGRIIIAGFICLLAGAMGACESNRGNQGEATGKSEASPRLPNSGNKEDRKRFEEAFSTVLETKHREDGYAYISINESLVEPSRAAALKLRRGLFTD